MDKLDPTAIHVVGCAKTFADGTRGVGPIDIDIAAGETIAILGPSGCGKTTTLRMIAGLEQPDAGGRILFGARDVTDIAIERRDVGMVFQSYALFPNFDVTENIAYGLRVRGMGKAERQARARELMGMMRLDAFADRKVDQLSGGQKQRVALARALAIRPRALLLDEALTALDAKLRETLRVEIDVLLRGLGITTVYVTHDQAEAMSVGDRIIVMDGGRIAQVGTPRDVYRRPATRFIADFIGTMNEIPGEIRDGAFVCAGGHVIAPGLAAGTREIFFRPEAARLGEGSGNVLTGQIATTFFMGDRTRLVLQGFGPKPVVIETNATRDFEPGERVAFTLDPAALIAL